MTISEFNNLSLDQRMKYVRREGVLIDTIEYNGFKVLLYSHGTFFFEVYYMANEIEKIVMNDYDPTNFPLGLAFVSSQ